MTRIVRGAVGRDATSRVDVWSHDGRTTMRFYFWTDEAVFVHSRDSTSKGDDDANGGRGRNAVRWMKGNFF